MAEYTSKFTGNEIDTRLEKIDGFETHTEDLDSHVTSEEKIKWNEAADNAIGRPGTVPGAELFNAASIASNTCAHAEGVCTVASGAMSHAEGNNTRAEGSNSHSEGGGTVAKGGNSHAEGCNTIAASESQHVQGIWNIEDSEDKYAFIIGNGTSDTARSNAFVVSWDGSVASGSNTTASGINSHAEGSGTTASGSVSHAEGGDTTASGNASHSEGEGTKASSPNQHTQGKYNIEDSTNKYAFIIGNGTSDTERSNAFAVDWNGKIYVNNAEVGVGLIDLQEKIASNTSSQNVIASNVALNRGTLGYERKNLFKNTASNRNSNGVDFTVNSDGSVTVNGTASQLTTCYVGTFDFKAGTSYLLTGCHKDMPEGTRLSLLTTITQGELSGTADSGSGATIKRDSDKTLYLRIRIPPDAVMDNVVFYPMLRYADISDDSYEPYKPSVEERLAALEGGA